MAADDGSLRRPFDFEAGEGPVYFAAVGDVHGRFASMIEKVEMKSSGLLPAGTRLSFVIQVGDIECHRDENDLKSMAAPQKHRKLGDFADVVWNKRATEQGLPWPLYFIGGNHESWGFLDTEHPNGGLLCPNMFFAGRWAVDELAGLTTVALSGIHRIETYRAGRRPPIELIEYKSNREWIGFSPEDLQGIWASTGQLEEGRRIDLLVVHDWPAGIAPREAIGPKASTSRELGNQPCRDLVDGLQPRLVLAGHMHVPYRTKVGESMICCLAKVPSDDSVAVFCRLPDGSISELT